MERRCHYIFYDHLYVELEMIRQAVLKGGFGSVKKHEKIMRILSKVFHHEKIMRENFHGFSLLYTKKALYGS